MKGYAIPRGDFESYFLRAEPGTPPRGKAFRGWVRSELEKLHPGFGESHAADVKKLRVPGGSWYLATVMRQEVLAEHRALARRAPLVAAEWYVLDAEGAPTLPTGESHGPKRASRLGPSFAKRPGRAAAYVSLAALLFAACALALPRPGRATAGSPVSPSGVVIETERAPPLPDAADLFALIASRIADTGATVSDMEVSSRESPPVRISVGGKGPSAVMASLEGAVPLDAGSFGPVSFSGNVPRYSLSYGFSGNGISPPTEGVAPSSALAFLSRAAESLTASGGTLEAARLGGDDGDRALFIEAAAPLSRSGSVLLGLTETAKASGLVVVSAFAEAGGQDGVLRLRLSLRTALTIGGNPEEGADSGDFGPIEARYADVPRAFGFFAAAPSSQTTLPGKGTGPESGWAAIGTIVDARGRRVVYYRDSGGKIHEIEN